jgi:dynein light chain LC8-type
LEVTNANHACFLTGGGHVIASLAIDHARSRHRRRERSSRGDHRAIAFADGVLVVGRLPLANGRARSPRRSVFGARTLAKIVPSPRDEPCPRPGSVSSSRRGTAPDRLSPRAPQALEKYNIEKDIAAFIKKEFDKKYNPTWHCIVGRNFGSYVTHETKHFIYFYLGQVAVLLFKSG